MVNRGRFSFTGWLAWRHSAWLVWLRMKNAAKLTMHLAVSPFKFPLGTCALCSVVAVAKLRAKQLQKNLDFDVLQSLLYEFRRRVSFFFLQRCLITGQSVYLCYISVLFVLFNFVWYPVFLQCLWHDSVTLITYLLIWLSTYLYQI